jgi:hypothetical protein
MRSLQWQGLANTQAQRLCAGRALRNRAFVPICPSVVVHKKCVAPSRRCKAVPVANSDTSTKEADAATKAPTAPPKVSDSDTKIKKTLAGLDAILGIEEEVEEPEPQKQDAGKVRCSASSVRLAAACDRPHAAIASQRAADSTTSASVSVANAVLEEITKKEAQRLAGSDPKKSAEIEAAISEQMVRAL